MLDPRRRSEAQPVVSWMRRNGDALFLSAMTLTEMESGLLKLRREGKDKRAAEVTALIDRIEAAFGERILPMDAPVARAVARIGDLVRPRVIELADLIIAATAQVHGLTVLTNNVR